MTRTKMSFIKISAKTWDQVSLPSIDTLCNPSLNISEYNLGTKKLLTFQSTATCRKNNGQFKVFYKDKKFNNGESGSLSCGTGRKMINCVYYSPWWFWPAGVQDDGTVDTSNSLKCETTHCQLSAICLLKSGMSKNVVLTFSITQEFINNCSGSV